MESLYTNSPHQKDDVTIILYIYIYIYTALYPTIVSYRKKIKSMSSNEASQLSIVIDLGYEHLMNDKVSSLDLNNMTFLIA